MIVKYCYKYTFVENVAYWICHWCRSRVPYSTTTKTSALWYRDSLDSTWRYQRRGFCLPSWISSASTNTAVSTTAHRRALCLNYAQRPRQRPDLHIFIRSTVCLYLVLLVTVLLRRVVPGFCQNDRVKRVFYFKFVWQVLGTRSFYCMCQNVPRWRRHF